MKKKTIVVFMLLLGVSTAVLVAYVGMSTRKEQHIGQKVACKDQFPTFYDWKKACDALPHYNERVRNPYKTILQEHTLLAQMDRFFSTMDDQIAKVCWIDGIKPKSKSTQFQAYVEKLIVPTDAVIAIHGDFHGDVRAINRFIETFVQQGFLDENDPFKIKADNFYILFLGDYVDRGWYGAEVIYTILRLKNENPDRVFMTRGNHEDADLNAHYGFRDELLKKFRSSRLQQKVETLYNVLPLALYLGAGNPSEYNIIQCCHGGIEIGFDPRPLLEHAASYAGVCFNSLMQKDGFKPLAFAGLSSFLRYFKNNKSVDTDNGFMWSDFIVNPTKALSLSPRDGYAGSLFEYGKQATKELLKSWSGKSYKIRSIFRAHQHSDEDMCNRIFNGDKLGHIRDIGVAKLWIENKIHQVTPWLLEDIAVVTFSVAPETEYGWPFHSFGELHVAPDYQDWRLYVYQKDCRNQS